jgi:hypothetical protein
MQISPKSVWHIVKKPLFVNPYRLQSLQAFSVKYEEVTQIYLRLFFYVASDVENIMSKGVFSGKAAIYRLGK